jgi:hypothetical protein
VLKNDLPALKLISNMLVISTYSPYHSNSKLSDSVAIKWNAVTYLSELHHNQIISMRKLFFFSLSMIVLFTCERAKSCLQSVFPNAVHHEAHIELTVTGIPCNPPFLK